MKKILLLAIIFMLLPINIFAKDSYDKIDIKIGKSVNEKENLKLKSKSNLFIITSDDQVINKTNNKEIDIMFDGKNINLKGNNFKLANFPQDGAFLIGSDSPIYVDKIKRNYRGAISFRVNNGKLDVVNNVNIDDYLRGVLPKEMSPEFPMESLKAQALCSRSFAINNFNKYIKKGYNLDDTTNSQVYYGKDVEEKSTDKAVESTLGEVIKYDGKIAETIFCASSGGYTVSSSEAWGGNFVPYLISKEDPYSVYPWEYTIKDSDLKKLDLTDILGVNLDSTSSNRVKNITFKTSKGNITLKANDFRNKIGNTIIKSTLFDINCDNGKIIVKGNGYGHGVGMSQYGAVEMAKKGSNYKDIIEFYFPGTNIEKIK
ncbi:MAG: SpoIID/LytB domain-containing protein [Peptoniphilus sp.]|uniref:SpoIID/LytB domain-containing protein n=1 Tax=Peptoniphilus sp. TaxID=1971214 RepID=UPI0025CCE71F|nr:SpoIID/LytB domain-containing protein [Peptoniphilus sp.]MCI5643629.1 SpoIID/LytB domain-containing protein [Peptoniphilus sp.]MDD7351919.1 SpoIID/LytB domain-containing protein [Peptoniphilaceae bacterium]